MVDGPVPGFIVLVCVLRHSPGVHPPALRPASAANPLLRPNQRCSCSWGRARGRTTQLLAPRSASCPSAAPCTRPCCETPCEQGPTLLLMVLDVLLRPAQDTNAALDQRAAAGPAAEACRSADSTPTSEAEGGALSSIALAGEQREPADSHTTQLQDTHTLLLLRCPGAGQHATNHQQHRTARTPWFGPGPAAVWWQGRGRCSGNHVLCPCCAQA